MVCVRCKTMTDARAFIAVSNTQIDKHGRESRRVGEKNMALVWARGDVEDPATSMWDSSQALPGVEGGGVEGGGDDEG